MIDADLHINTPASESCLCETFRELSTWTWQMLATAAEFNMPCQEETLTDFLLLQLAARCKSRIKVVPFTKRAEAANGADWEWWFCDWPGGIGLRIQAKRVFQGDWKFHSLKFPRKHVSQTDILIREALKDGLVPLYCFYVFQSRTHHSKGLDLGHGEGCLLMSADAVASVRKKHAQRLLPNAFPWQELVCQPAGQPRSLSQIEQRVRALTANPIAGGIRELPNYVMPYALETKRISMDASAGQYERQQASSVRGMVIVQV